MNKPRATGAPVTAVGVLLEISLPGQRAGAEEMDGQPIDALP